MPIVQFVGTILLVALLLWGINAFPYFDAGMKKFASIVIIIVAAAWAIGLIFHVGPTSLQQMKVG